MNLPIPLNPLHKNLEEMENVNAVSFAMDIMDNHQGNWQKRPGLTKQTLTDGTVLPEAVVLDSQYVAETEYGATPNDMDTDGWAMIDHANWAETLEEKNDNIDTHKRYWRIYMQPAITGDYEKDSGKLLGAKYALSTIIGRQYTFTVEAAKEYNDTLFNYTDFMITASNSELEADVIAQSTPQRMSAKYTSGTYTHTITFTAAATTTYLIIGIDWDSTEQRRGTQSFAVYNVDISEDEFKPFATVIPDTRTDELHWNPYGNYALIFSGAEIYKLTRDSDGDFICTLLNVASGSFNSVLTAGERPVIQNIDEISYIANGKHIGYTDGTDFYDLYLEAPNSPTNCLSLAYLNQRLIALDEDLITWSEVNAPKTWEADSFISAEVSQDKNVAMGVSWGELTVFGERTTQGFYDDGSGIVPKIGASTEVGISAPSSLVKIDQVWYFLDHDRNVVVYAPGTRTPKPLSFPIANELNNLSSVSDARGYYVKVRGHKLYILSFKDADRTFVFNTTTQTWHEWGYWNKETANHVDFIGFSSMYVDKWNLILWGDRRVNNGNIYVMDHSVYQDNGESINSVLRTGQVDRGTPNEKICNYIRLRLKRGTGPLSGVTPYLSVRYKDDYETWSNPVFVDLGKIGDDEITLRVSGLGRYRTRQWEFSVMNNCDIIIMNVFEDFEVLFS